ncbi:MAG: MFS transporter, partial [Vulcanimicrobiaceae bacterium]
TLSTSLWLVVAGLVLLATGTFWAQTASQGLIGKVVESQRSSAVALYLTVYYILGGLGAIVPAAFWKSGGWPATVALVIAVQLLAGALTWFGWRGQMMLARKDSRAPNLGT